jgi:Tol biopolymer transport system component
MKMKRILSFAKGALGLAALVAFVLVLVGLFGPLSQRVPVGQQTYPIGTVTPTAPLPPATATPEPYPPPGPYPPPRTPTPVPSPSPTFSPTPPLPTPPGPIPSTYDIIWAETAWIREENRPVSITFWRANVADLDNRTEIATLSVGHKIYRASLSPDGDYVAFTTCPSIGGCVHFWDGVLWVMNIDDSGLTQLAQGIDGSSYPTWSRDGKTVTYRKEVLKSPPPASTDVSSLIYEIHTVATDGTGDKALVVDDTADSITPLGWSSDGRMLYYARIVPGTGHELWAVDADGERPPQFASSLFSGWGVVRFSPDGTKLTIYSQEEGLVLLSSDGQERRVLSPPSEPFSGIWSADSTEIIGHYWDRLQLRAVNVNTRAARDLITPQLTDRDRLISTSPDGQWLALQIYGSGRISLLWIGTSVRVEVSETGILSFIGWIARGP